MTILREGEDSIVRIHVVRRIVEIRVPLAVVVHVQHSHVLVAVGVRPNPTIRTTIIHTTTRC